MKLLDLDRDGMKDLAGALEIIDKLPDLRPYDLHFRVTLENDCGDIIADITDIEDGPRLQVEQ